MASKLLTVAAVPLDIAWSDRAENLYQAGRIMAGLRGCADIIVLPELFSTGFVSDAAQLVELADTDSCHPALDTMRTAAARANAAVCGSVLYSCSDQAGRVLYYNRCLFVEPDGETTVYDKHHLFCLGAEPRVMSPGRTPVPVIRFRGCNVAMAVCFDLRFPTWLRNHSTNPYDVLLLPSNWPQARRSHWETLLSARAIENQAYVVGANRTGSDDMGCYDDMTRICDAMGNDVGRPDLQSGVVFAAIDIDGLQQLRRSMPFLDCAD